MSKTDTDNQFTPVEKLRLNIQEQVILPTSMPNPTPTLKFPSAIQEQKDDNRGKNTSKNCDCLDCHTNKHENCNCLACTLTQFNNDSERLSYLGETNIWEEFPSSCMVMALTVFEHDTNRERWLEILCPLYLSNIYQIGCLAQCFDHCSRKFTQLFKDNKIIIDENKTPNIVFGHFMSDTRNMNDDDRIYMLERFKKHFKKVYVVEIFQYLNDFETIEKVFNIFDIKPKFSDLTEHTIKYLIHSARKLLILHNDISRCSTKIMYDLNPTPSFNTEMT